MLKVQVKNELKAAVYLLLKSIGTPPIEKFISLRITKIAILIGQTAYILHVFTKARNQYRITICFT